MKILVERKPFQDFSLQLDCNGIGWRNTNASCGSTLELEIKDIVRRKWSKYPDQTGFVYGYTCPVCNCFNIVEIDKLPKDIDRVARDYDETLLVFNHINSN